MHEKKTAVLMTGRPLRADARRNYDRILAAAEATTAQHGADISLEEIARQAGVGSATLHRHFASRQALFEAVFHDRVVTLCAQVGELAHDTAPGPALIAWLRAVVSFIATTRGLAASLLRGLHDGETVQGESETCYAMINSAGTELLRRAQGAGSVRTGVSIHDLLTLMNAISLVTEQADQSTAEAERLLTLVIDGISLRADHT